jgi:sugar/nucleoside kinase (ribokinase family)
MNRPLALVGHSCLDRIEDEAGSITLRAGGVPVYAGAALAAAGRVCTILTRYDAADFVITKALDATGCELRILSADESTVFEFARRNGTIGEPSLASEAPPIAAGELEFEGAHAAYFGPLTPRDIDLDCYRLARARGMTVFLDAQGLTRQESTQANRDRSLSILSLVDVVKVTAAEAAWLFGTDDPAELKASFAALGVSEVALTLGASGSLVMSEAGMDLVPTTPALEALDTVGCGDIYFATYIDSWLEGCSPPECGHRATEAVIRKLGSASVPATSMAIEA